VVAKPLSIIIGRFLDKKTAYQNIFELDGGINRGWIDKGLATTKIAANYF
jgi:hypothetical protein